MRWAIVTLVGLLAAPAMAASEGVVMTDLGVLTCTLAPTGETGTDPDSQSKAMLCTFKPKGTGPEETYTGEIKKVGSQTALTGKQVLIWAVMGPDDRELTPAILEQTYVGEAAADPGDKSAAPKRLTGERDNTFELQPVTDGSPEPSATDSVTVIELRIKTTAT